jgi:hypothetical protein
VGAGSEHARSDYEASEYARPRRTVRVEVLVLDDCPYRDWTIALVERAIAETGVSARVDVVEVTNQPQAELKRFLGSPSVQVDGRDVEPDLYGRDDFAVESRIYRTGRGISGWPEEGWVRDALLRAAAIGLVSAS